ncbi:MAG: segregation/condensation protein A [Phycisphaerales bacterium]|nr:segregation/condensation protein A [Phycisphaerales bacterium]
MTTTTPPQHAQAVAVGGHGATEAGAGTGGGGADYTVSLDAFQGPLDLLLFLIRRAEVDIHDIPVGTITDQYMAYLKQLVRIDIEEAGEFLVMAATLMEVKSRMLAPKPEVDEAAPDAPLAAVAAEDPRADLVRQLLAYKKFRDAASALEDRMVLWEARLPGAAAGVPDAPVVEADEDAAVEIDDLDLIDLVEAFAKIIETVDLSRVGEHTVKDDETPIEIHAEDIMDRLGRDGEDVVAPMQDGSPGPTLRGLSLRRMFIGRTRPEAVGLFLAMLELMKQQRLVAWQDASNPGVEGIYLAIKPAA